MAIIDFPPIDQADENGLLALGGDIEVSSLLLAYSKGIFPWPINDEYPLAWFSPNPRGILKYEDLHISSSLKKYLKSNKHRVTFNEDFEGVIKACSKSKNRKDQVGTWITDEIIQAYIDFYNADQAYSVEVWNNDNKLIGGLYGVIIGSYVSGESMFYLESNASKLALHTLMERLNDNDITWLDTQMVTPVVEAMGGTEMSRDDFLNEVKKTVFNSSLPSLFA